MSQRVYVVTMHTGNTLTVMSRKFIKGKPVVLTDEKLVDYLRGHPNFKIESKVVKDDSDASDVVASVAAKAKEAEKASEAGGENTTESAAAAIPTPVVKKNPTPVKKTSAAQ